MIKKYYSQAGQDKWVLKDVFSFKKTGYFLEIGAFDGIYLSNTYVLEKEFKWSGLCIEGNPLTYRKLCKNRKSKCINACVGPKGGIVDFNQEAGTESGAHPLINNLDCELSNKRVGIVRLQTTPLAELLDMHQCPETIDYLSVDVEGMEEEVLKTFPFDRKKFICATIERPSNDLRILLQTQGYVLVIDQPGLDAFYIHESFKSAYTDRIIQNNRRNQASVVAQIGNLSMDLYRNGIRSTLNKIKYS